MLRERCLTLTAIAADLICNGRGRADILPEGVRRGIEMIRISNIKVSPKDELTLRKVAKLSESAKMR